MLLSVFMTVTSVGWLRADNTNPKMTHETTGTGNDQREVVYANGNPVTVKANGAEGVTIECEGEDPLSFEDGSIVILYGGKKNLPVTQSTITMTGGVLRNLYGGGNGELVAAGATKDESTYANVTGPTKITITGGSITNLLVAGGLYYAQSEDVVIEVSGDVSIAYPFMGGFEAGATKKNTIDTEYANSVNRVKSTKFTMTSGEITGYIGCGGGQGYSYSKSTTVELNDVKIATLYGIASNGRSDKVDVQVNNCSISEEIATLNRGRVGDVNLTFNSCTFDTGIKAFVGAVEGWADSDTDGRVIPNVTGTVSYTFNGNAPLVRIGQGLDAANVNLTGAKASVEPFKKKTADAEGVKAFTIGEKKIWNFYNGLLSTDGATLTPQGTGTNKAQLWNMYFADGKPISLEARSGSEKGVKIGSEDYDETLTVYGGSYKKDISGSTSITMNGGTVKNIYGGGFGSKKTENYTANVAGDVAITINKGTVTNILAAGGMYKSKIGGEAKITAKDANASNAWIMGGGYDSGETGNTLDTEFDASVNSIPKTTISLTGGTYGTIALGGGQGYSYSKNVEATIDEAIIGGLYGTGSNGRSDVVTATLKGCTFKDKAEIASINRGTVKDITMTFDDKCTFGNNCITYLGAVKNWENSKDHKSYKAYVSGKATYTFNANNENVYISSGLENANLQVTGANVKIAAFQNWEGNVVKNFVVATGKTWIFNDGHTLEGDASLEGDVKSTVLLAAITNLPDSVVFGTAPIALAFNQEGVKATIAEGSDKAEISDNVLKIKKPGTVKISLTVANSKEKSNTQSLKINKRTVTLVEGLTAEAREYNGTTNVTLTKGTLKFAGKLGPDATNLDLANGFSGVLADANAGGKKPVKVTATLSGDSADYYTLAPITFVTDSVWPKAITITANTIASSNYGEERTFTVADYSSDLKGDKLNGTLKFDCAATSTSPEGEYAITPYGLSNPNYAITYKQGKLTVKAIAPTIELVSAEVVTNGDTRDIKLTAKLTDLGGTDTAKLAEAKKLKVTFLYNNDSNASEDGVLADGLYTATIAGIIPSTTDATYKIKAKATINDLTGESAALDVVINSLKPQNISFAESVLPTVVYGSSITLGASSSETAATGEYAYELEDSDIAEIQDGKLIANGVGKVVLTVSRAKDGTYAAATAKKTIEITRKPITVNPITAGDIKREYNGTTNGIDKLASKLTLNGVETGDDVKVKDFAFSFSGKNAGTQDIILPVLSLEGDAADNYTLIQPTGLKGVIEKAPLTIKVEDATRNWNDLYTKYEFGFTPEEALSKNGETLSMAYSGSLDVTETAEGKLHLTVNPALCPNYDLQVGKDATLTINKGTPVAIVVKFSGMPTALLVDSAGWTDLTVSGVDGTGRATVTSTSGETWSSLNQVDVKPLNQVTSLAMTKAVDNNFWSTTAKDVKTIPYTKGRTFDLSVADYISTTPGIISISGATATIVGTGKVAIVKKDGTQVALMNITPADLYAVADMSKTYDGKTQTTGSIKLMTAATGGTELSGVDVALNQEDVTFNFNEAGVKANAINPSQALILTGSEANNYKLNTTLAGSIAKKVLKITTINKYYDGSAVSSNVTDYTAEGLISGDIVPVKVAFKTANVGATLVESNPVQLMGEGNYELSTDKPTSAAILKSTFVATLPASATTKENVVSGTKFVISQTGADVKVNNATLAYNPDVAQSGTSPVVFYVTGGDTDNYSVVYTSNQVNKSSSVPPVVNPPVEATGVTLDVTAKTLAVGESFTLVATVTPANADDTSVSWSSSDPTIASVDADGKVTALKAGKATITATSNDNPNFTATCKVSVEAPTGIEEALADSRVYAKEGYIYIEPMAEMQVVIVSMEGKTIYNNRISGQKQIPATPGVYVVKLISAGKVVTSKVGVF
ncbi:hypothetical protein DW103_09705 [Parabacteroides sp. AM08-6]|nr:hypothetical protein DW103_09705 [Parabacteroides sp. AM08-6]